MIERKRYLELCQKSSVDRGSVKVLYDGSEYFPHSYRLWFDKQGNTCHGAILRDIRANSIIECRLQDVSEII